MYSEAISEVFGFALKAGVLYVVFRVAKGMTAESSIKPAKCYANCIIVAMALGVLSWATLGTHIEDSDPVFGGGQTVTDFEPTEDEKTVAGIKTFLFVLGTSSIGVFFGLKERKEPLD